MALVSAFSAPARAQTAPLLQLQGQPYSQGSMTLHLTADPGVPAVMFYGLNALSPPAMTTKGPFHVGTVLNVVWFSVIPPGGRYDLPFVMPPLDPSLAGLSLVMQGLVPGSLTNPATLPLDQPHHLASEALVLTAPQPTVQGKFGDQIAVGDLNGDGDQDIIVGAWYEKYQGVQFSGRVYIFWGPDHASVTPLASPNPYPACLFGAGLLVADYDGDGVEDLAVGQEGGFQPFAPPGPAFLHFYMGANSFPTTPTFTRTSTEIAENSSPYGRFSAVGDLNSDGLPDIAVGIPNAPFGSIQQAGCIRVFWAPDFTANALIFSPTPHAEANFGSAVAIGDVTGDGVNDLIEGSGRADVSGFSNVGQIHAYDGNGLSLMLTIDYPLQHATQVRFADAVHVADTDGDGVGEIIADDGLDHVFVFWSLSPTDYQVIPKPPGWATNPFGETQFGFRLGAADLNADGFVDIIISDMFEGPVNCATTPSSGLIYASLGPWFSTFQHVLDVSPACGNAFAFHFDIADVNRDGLDDLLVGSAVADDNGLQNSGHITIFGF